LLRDFCVEKKVLRAFWVEKKEMYQTMGSKKDVERCNHQIQKCDGEQ